VIGEPPTETWSRAEALREILRIGRGLGYEDFERDVLPRLRRLSVDQRRQVARAMRSALAEARARGDWQKD